MQFVVPMTFNGQHQCHWWFGTTECHPLWCWCDFALQVPNSARGSPLKVVTTWAGRLTLTT